MPVRASMLFELTTTRSDTAPIERTAGWSENYWMAGESISAARILLEARNGPLDARLRLLPRLSGIISAVRYQVFTLVDTDLVPSGGALPVPVGRAGTVNLLNDVPQMAFQLRLKLADGQPGTCTHRIAGIPDASVVGGEASLSIDMKDRLDRFIKTLGVVGAVVTDRTTTRYKLLSIDADGVAKRFDGGTFGVGTLVQILRAKDPITGKIFGGVFRVEVAGVPANTFTLQGYPDTWPALTGGSVRIYQKVFKTFDVDKGRLVRSVIRKVGRPFVRYVGRSSKRR